MEGFFDNKDPEWGWGVREKGRSHVDCIGKDKLMCGLFFFFKDSINLCLDRGEGREKVKHQYVVASCAPPTGDLVRNPGMCPDWESNR